VSIDAATVVVPTRNRPELLSVGLRSIFAQRDVNLEIIVIDDGSRRVLSHDCPEVRDPRVRVIRNEESRGPAEARNQGIAAAANEWLAFCDDDDLWAPTKLARQLRLLHETNRRWCYSGTVIVDSALRVVGGGRAPEPQWAHEALLSACVIPGSCSSVIVHASALHDAGLFDPTFNQLEDWDLWIRLSRTAGLAASDDYPAVAYRLHGENRTTAAHEALKDFKLIKDRYDPDNDAAGRDLALFHRWSAWAPLLGGQRWLAARAYLRAVRAGDLTSLGRTAIALTQPLSRAVVRRLTQADPEYQKLAEAWLLAYRQKDPVRES
jgi:glycosyltransferase involved in cell wall biosynthesis